MHIKSSRTPRNGGMEIYILHGRPSARPWKICRGTARRGAARIGAPVEYRESCTRQIERMTIDMWFALTRSYDTIARIYELHAYTSNDTGIHFFIFINWCLPTMLLINRRSSIYTRIISSTIQVWNTTSNTPSGKWKRRRKSEFCYDFHIHRWLAFFKSFSHWQNAFDYAFRVFACSIRSL